MVINSEFRDAHAKKPCSSLLDGLGANFKVGNGKICNRLLINFTENYFLDNDNGVSIQGGNCTYDLHFSKNNITRSCKIGLGILTKGDGRVNIANSYFTNSSGLSLIFIQSSVTLTVEKTVIAQNKKGILALLTKENIVSLLIKDSCFYENSEASLKVTNLQADTSETTSVFLNNATFLNNTSLKPGSGIIQMEQKIALNIENRVFQSNQGSSILAFKTTVTLFGIVTFENNFQGGAILLRNSLLQFRVVSNNTTALFTIT